MKRPSKRTRSGLCRNGLHEMTGRNLLWHTRYDPKTGEKLFKWFECRACSNARYRAKRNAAKRNRELAEEAARLASGENPLCAA